MPRQLGHDARQLAMCKAGDRLNDWIKVDCVCPQLSNLRGVVSSDDSLMVDEIFWLETTIFFSSIYCSIYIIYPSIFLFRHDDYT